MSSGIRRRHADEQKKNVEENEQNGENEKIQRELEKDSSLLRPFHWKFIAVFYLALILGASFLHKCLPEPKDPNKEETQFSENRAVKILHELSGYGWKPAGSYNYVDNLRFEIDTQYVSGCFDIPAHDTEGMNICYRNVSNVIARLGKGAKKDQISVLLNCHYDSWPTSNAGSDDLSSCALMLELIRLYSKNPKLLVHDVIFLFNGAEESSLLAAHGFITQHSWRHEIRAFINLEASGSGGRELLFQAGPANQWLLNSYLEAAIHPHCSVIGQEVFQSGVYPGDTDFRIFRDHGRVPGLDLAFVQNGYWWHTEFDTSERITRGSLQRAGENVFHTLNHLLNSPYLEKPNEHSDRKSVFFDFLGLFVVIYPLSFAHFLNMTGIITIFGLVSHRFYKSTFLTLLALRDYLLTLLTIAIVLKAMTFMSLFTYGALRWYTRHWLALVAYGLPSVWAGLSVQGLLSARLNPRVRSDYGECLELIHLTFLSGILLIFTYYDVASGFLFALLLIPVTKSLASFFGAWPNCPTINTVLTLIISFPGCAMAIYTTEMLLSIFIPIMGRSSYNPEPVVSCFVSFSAGCIVLSLSGLVAKSRNSRPMNEAGIREIVYNLLGVLLVTLSVLYVFSSFWPSPYRFDETYPTAKRTQFFHVNQIFYDRNGQLSTNETRFYAISHDYRGAEDIPFVKNDPEYTGLQCHYENNPWCEVPFLFPTKSRLNDRNIRVRVVDEHLKFKHPVKILGISKKHSVDTSDGKGTIEYSFSVIGTGQISAYVIPDTTWLITNTSVTQPKVPQENMFLYFTCSVPNNICEWIFKIKIKKSTQTPSDEKPLLVGISSHHLHGPDMQSQSIRNMIEKIKENRVHSPEWTVTASAWNVDQVYKYF
uniref:FXNA-like protease n=1 Tax=Caenorhabditis tropicalis TaxID=1561998 RepID=A0A1I7TV69_9PELO